MKRISLGILILAPLLVVSGCATQQSRYEMCFGRSMDSGRTIISDQEWQSFREGEIAGRFPDGFTVCHGDGYWRSGSVTYTEPSEILMVVAPDTQETQQKLDAIASAYVRRFHQDAVLQIKSQADVSFRKPADNIK